LPRAAAAVPRFLRRPEARPEELVAAALAVFGERGFRQTTLEEVAARAGVSKGTVYLYFKSKDDLFRAVVKLKVAALLEPAEAMARAHDGSATELLVKLVHRLWAAMAQDDMICLSRLVQAELNHFPEIRRYFFDDVIQRHRRLLRGIAARGVATGEFRPEATMLLPRVLPALVSQLNQMRSMYGDLDRGAPSPEKLRDAMLTMVLDGVRTGAPASSPKRRASRGAVKDVKRGQAVKPRKSGR
jgi:AcrR family transcriptional regulator